jgi:N-acetyl-gamma-glutamyl-phosphate reductase
LLPARRGIIAGIYCRLSENKSVSDIQNAFTKAYAKYPLVTFSVLSENSHLLSLKRVVGTGRTHITFEVKDKKLFLFSCIDNLMKGAASQAVENFNRIINLPLVTALNELEAIV